MIISYFFGLLGWLPGPLAVIAFGVVSIFLLWSILKIVAMILDIIPFL